MWHIPVKLLYIWTSGSGDVLLKKQNKNNLQTMHNGQRTITIAHLESKICIRLIH